MNIFVFVFLSIYSLNILAMMESDEEYLQKPEFVAQYNCSVDYFLIKKFFEKKEWNQALNTIETLERQGYSDRFLTVAKAKLLMKQGKLEKSLENFQKALNESYQCGLTIPKITFVKDISLARDAIIWHYIAQIYELMGNLEQAIIIQDKAEKLLEETVEKGIEKDEFKKRFFILFSLFREPLTP